MDIENNFHDFVKKMNERGYVSDERLAWVLRNTDEKGNILRNLST